MIEEEEHRRWGGGRVVEGADSREGEVGAETRRIRNEKEAEGVGHEEKKEE